MDDENDANLDVVFENCKNDFQLFLSTIAKYLGKKADFSTCDLTHVSELFANAANSSKSHNINKPNNIGTHELSNDIDNRTTNDSNAVLLLDDTSCDMFETENVNNNADDDEIIPETQMYPDESNDSGESVTIPLYVKMNGTNDSFNTTPGASEDESEFLQVRPESVANDHTQTQQSQMLMANMDRSILCDIETSYIDANANKSSDILISAQTETSSIETNSGNTDKPVNGKSNEDRVDRSASTTPDLDCVEKEPLAKQQGNDDNDDDDLNETQMFTQCLYDASTQQLVNEPEHASTEDIFLAATEETVFKLPAAISTPRTRAKQNLVVQTHDSIFDEPTQKSDVPTSRQEDPYEVATQLLAPQEDIYEMATQINTQQEDLYEMATQIAHENNVYEAATQQLPSGRSTSTKKTVTWKQTDKIDAQKSKEHNMSDDLFEIETQVFEAPEPPNGANDDLNETEIFDMPTQVAVMPSTTKNIQRKQYPAVLTQSSQPANTPEWSMAARISNAQIDQFEKEQAVREAAKKRNKLKKHRYLFATSEDEGESEDDLDFDLPVPNPVERMPSLKENQKRSKPDDCLNRPSSESSNDSDSFSKKSKPNIDDQIPKKIEERRLSVKLLRAEVDNYFKSEEKKHQSNSKKSAMLRDEATSRGRTAKATETRDNEIMEKTEQRKLRGRKSEVEMPSMDTRNKRKASEKGEAPSKEKRQSRERPGMTTSIKDDPKTKPSVLNKSKGTEPKTRNARKDKSQESTVMVSTTNIPDSNLLSLKRRTSERPSTHYSLRPAILFTKVNSAPYTKLIQNLGGCIVDTPQLGTVLICDKISRTFKFLYALSKGIPIVSSHWLDASAKCGEFECTDPYLVVDKNSETRFRFSLKNSLESARKTPLFVNYHICTTPNVQPITSEIAEIVECAGGKYANSPLKKREPNTIAVLISHKKDSKMWKSYRDAHPDIQIINSEGFLQSVVQQKINFPDYILT